MPVVRTMLDMNDVMAILTRKGYGVNRDRRYDLQLTIATERQYSSGAYERKLLKGLSREETHAVLGSAESPDEAALLFEDLSLGKISSAVEATRTESASTGLSAEALSNIIDNRVAFGVQQAVEPHMREIMQIKTDIAALVAELRTLTAEKPQKPEKKGRKSKVMTAEKADAILAELDPPAA